MLQGLSAPPPPPPPPPRMRTRDVSVPGDGTAMGTSYQGRGLCCPDDPLDLVLQLFPTDRVPPPSSLAALGIGTGAAGEETPARRVIKQEPGSPPQPQPLPESAFGVGGGGVGGLQDSWSSFVLEGLCTGLDGIDDVDMFFADDDNDDALDNGGGEATQGNLLSEPTNMAAAASGPVHRGSSGGAVVVPNDASPFLLPMPAGAFPLQPYDACRVFDATVFSNAPSPPAPATATATAAPVPAGCPPPWPFFVTNNTTPPLPALIMPAAPAPMPAACGSPPVFVTNNSTPEFPALILPAAAPTPMPPPAAASLHACAALPGIVSNMAHAPPPPLMAPLPSRALHPNAGVYSYTNAPPSATPSSSPPSLTSFGSGHSLSSETEFLQPHHHHVCFVPRKLRSPPSGNRRKRPWLLDFPLHALPPVAPPPPANHPTGDDNVDDNKGNDDAIKNSNSMALVALAPPGNTTSGDVDIAAADSGGIIRRRRRAAPRQRNRQAQRVCSHCHSPETPQWRAGPDGPGTLCNACGIRYAANRLLPEYRPSTAPSFKSGQHSNRHRKVMKLREQMTMKPAVATEEKPPPPLEQQPVEDDRMKEEEDDDGSFMGVCEYISAAGF